MTQALFHGVNVSNANKGLMRVIEYCEDHWPEFKPYADETFHCDIRKALEAALPNPCDDELYQKLIERFWEMYVGCELLGNKVVLVPWNERPAESRSKGPDFLASDGGTKIWIECIAVGPGRHGATCMCVASEDGEQGEPEAYDAELPDRNAMLRVTNGFDKKSKTLDQYIRDEVVDEADAAVIAINYSSVARSEIGGDVHLPIVPRALYGVAPTGIVANGTLRWHRQSHIDKIGKNSKVVPVPTGDFAERNLNAAHVSGVLYSAVDPSKRESMVPPALAHNPNARVGLPASWLAGCTQFRLKDDAVEREDPRSV